jgi:hypothetical protein
MTSRHVTDRLLSAACVVALLAALIRIDARVRERFWSMVDQMAQGNVPWVEEMGTVGDALLQSVQDMSLEHAPLLIFSFVALVLVMFMLRT